MNRHPKIAGYAAVWGAVSRAPKNGFIHRFACSAFSDSIKSDDICALWLHKWEFELAFNDDRRRGSLLSLREDGHGLACEIQPYGDRDWIDYVISEIRAGKVRGMSVGFWPIEGCRDVLASGAVVYTHTRAQLLEISPVYSPNFLETSVRLVESSAEPAVSHQKIERDVIWIDPALMSRPRRHIRAGGIFA